MSPRNAIIHHISRRALQVLEGRVPDAEMRSLCGKTEDTVIGETEMRSILRMLVRDLLTEGSTGLEFPEWAGGPEPTAPEWWDEDTRGPYPYTTDREALCRFCCPEVRDVQGMLAVAVDRMLEQGHDGRTHEPFTRKKGQSPSDLLVAWLRKVGPQPKIELERFVWNRAHPDEPDMVEQYRGRFFMERQSAGMWGTNWPDLIRRGVIVRVGGGQRPLFGAP